MRWGQNKTVSLFLMAMRSMPKFPGDKQQCWVHLLRAAKQASSLLYHDLVTVYLKLGDTLTNQFKNVIRVSLSAAECLSTKSYHEGRVRRFKNESRDTITNCLPV